MCVCIFHFHTLCFSLSISPSPRLCKIANRYNTYTLQCRIIRILMPVAWPRCWCLSYFNNFIFISFHFTSLIISGEKNIFAINRHELRKRGRVRLRVKVKREGGEKLFWFPNACFNSTMWFSFSMWQIVFNRSASSFSLRTVLLANFHRHNKNNKKISKEFCFYILSPLHSMSLLLSSFIFVYGCNTRFMSFGTEHSNFPHVFLTSDT